MSYPFYLTLHFLGIFLLISTFGLFAGFHWLQEEAAKKAKKYASIAHGCGLLFALIGGMGLLARIGVPHGQLPRWALFKIIFWLLLGFLPLIIKKKKKLAIPLSFLAVIIAVLLGYTGKFKTAFIAQPAIEATDTQDQPQ